MRFSLPLVAVVLAAPAPSQTSIVTVDAAGALANNGSLYGELSLDARTIPPGIYLVRASGAHRTATRKLVIAR